MPDAHPCPSLQMVLNDSRDPLHTRIVHGKNWRTWWQAFTCEHCHFTPGVNSQSNLRTIVQKAHVSFCALTRWLHWRCTRRFIHAFRHVLVPILIGPLANRYLPADAGPLVLQSMEDDDVARRYSTWHGPLVDRHICTRRTTPGLGWTTRATPGLGWAHDRKEPRATS